MRSRKSIKSTLEVIDAASEKPASGTGVPRLSTIR